MIRVARCFLFGVGCGISRKPLEQQEFRPPMRPGRQGETGMAKRWYSVSVLSNFEKKIAEQIRTAVVEAGLQEEIDEVLVPTEEVLEVRRGKKVTSERRFMPGYVLVRMEMSNKGYHLISSINRVTGFLGPKASQCRCATPK